MPKTKYLNPSPKVSVNNDGVILTQTFSYDYDDEKLKTLSLENFRIYAERRFPNLDPSYQSTLARVVIRLPKDHALRHDAESEACGLLTSIVGECLPIFDKGIEIGFQVELSSKEEISALLERALSLIKELSTDIDALRGMRFQVSLLKKAKSSVWVFE
jgi:hypothetical protein